MLRYLSLLLIFAFCNTVVAQTNTVNSSQVFEFINSQTNFIKNPHARTSTVGVTVSGATKGRVTGATKFNGIASHTCTSGTVGQYCEASLRTVTAPHRSSKSMCEYIVWYSGTTASNWGLVVGSSQVPFENTDSGIYQQAYITQPCSSTPTAPRIQRLVAGSSNTIEYAIYYGPSTRLGTVEEDRAVFAAERNSGPQLIPTGTFTQIASFNAITSDNYSCSNGSGGCVIKKAGTYRAAGYLSWVMNTTGARSVEIRVNGSRPNNSCVLTMNVPNGPAPHQSNVTCIINVNTNDVVTLWAWQNTGAGLYLDNTYIGNSFASLNLNQTSGGAAASIASVDNQDTGIIPFTPVLSTGAFNPSAAAYKFTYSLKGPYMFLDVDYQSPTGGTIGSGNYALTIPGGYEISPTVANPATSTSTFGNGYAYTGTSEFDIVVGASTSTTLSFRFPTSETVMNSLGSTTFPLSNANMRLGFTARIPIKGRENLSPNGVLKIDPPVFNFRELSGTGTYTPGAGVKWIKVKMVGGGAGGAGSGTVTTGTSGTNGGNTTFGDFVANGGGPGNWQNLGVGGAVSGSIAGATIINMTQGGYGQGGQIQPSTNGAVQLTGGHGGNSCFGSGGTSQAGGQGLQALYYGGGGGGGGGDAVNSVRTGGGGGAGGCIEFYLPISSGATSFAYAVGGQGAGGAASTNGRTGAAGRIGAIHIEEHFTSFQSALFSGALSTVLPQTPGSLSSNSSSKDLVYRGTVVNNGSTCVVTSNTPGLSATRGGAGVCTVNFPSAFSSTAYQCNANSSTSAAPGARNGAKTTTAYDTVTYSISSGVPVATDATYDFICIGPR